jgi:lipopolysaccharide export system protein LptA
MLVQALSSDQYKPIEIKAGNAEFDQKTNTYSLNGNLIIVRGSIKINASSGVVRKMKDYDVIELFGNPILFTQLQDDGEVISGNCDHFDYNSSTNMANLRGNARVKKNNNVVSGSLISYNTKTEVYKVEGSKSYNINKFNDNRVTIILDNINNAK